MSYNLTPLDVCKRLIGREDEIAAICGISAKAPYGWGRQTVWRDAGDISSARYQRRLLAHSIRCGLGLTAEHLIRGASAAEIDAILAARSQQSRDGPQEAA